MSLYQNAGNFFSKASTFLSTIGSFFNCSASKDEKQNSQSPNNSPIDSNSMGISPNAKLSKADTSVGGVEEESTLPSLSSRSASPFSSISSISSGSKGSRDQVFSTSGDRSSLPLRHLTLGAIGTTRSRARRDTSRPQTTTRPNLPIDQNVGLGRPSAYTNVPSNNPTLTPQPDLHTKIMKGRDTSGLNGKMSKPDDWYQAQTTPVTTGVFRGGLACTEVSRGRSFSF